MNIVRGVLHVEGATLFVVATWAYLALLDGSWLVFLALILVPDVSLVGYLVSPRPGAWIYNLVHNEALPVVLVATGLATDVRPVLTAGLVLAAHVGMDRAAGYGLKFASGFKDTHMQRLS